jgi:hypothetical protein
VATTDKRALEGKVAAELHQIAADLGIEGHKGLKKADLVDKIIAHTNGERPDASSVAAAAPVKNLRREASGLTCSLVILGLLFRCGSSAGLGPRS